MRKGTVGKNRLELVRPQPKKGRRRPLKKILLLFLFIGAVSLILKAGTSYCRIEEITVSGNERLGEAEIISQSKVKKGTGLLLLHPGKVGRRVAELPEVCSVTVRRRLPSTLCIIVQEREAAASLLDQNRFWLVDGEGLIFAEERHPPDHLPVITGAVTAEIVAGQPLGQVKKSCALSSFLKALSQLPLLEPAELNLSDPANLVLYTLDGRRALLGDSDEMLDKLTLLQAFLQGGGAGVLLDLRTGDRLVVMSEERGW